MGFFDTPIEHPNQNLTQQFSQQLVKTLCSIENSQRVFLVRPIPEMAIDVPNTMARALMFGKSDNKVSISLDEYYHRQTAIWAAQDEAALRCGVRYPIFARMGGVGEMQLDVHFTQTVTI